MITIHVSKEVSEPFDLALSEKINKLEEDGYKIIDIKHSCSTEPDGHLFSAIIMAEAIVEKENE